ncbi:MAG: NADH-quinone oxidoreductase subunit NuoH [Myxococcales bacterium]|nr:NADH-quinone oxidoreductase subunit NuoH [Myxococcales bacterium]
MSAAAASGSSLAASLPAPLSDILAHPVGHGVIIGGIVMTFFMMVSAWSIWFERRFAGRMQSRVGPNMVGPAGLFQPLADAIKMMRKEMLTPSGADKVLFWMAPPLTLFFTLATLATIPLSEDLLIADLDIGLLWVLAFSGLMLFPTWIAGWSSNNKYALFAAMRAVAQGISYEVPLLLSAIVPVVAVGSFSIADIVRFQGEHGWLLFWPVGPGALGFVIFFVASLAEANRIPFDIPEAESELVAGVTVEYSAMMWGLFPMTEYVHTLIASALASALFLGGWYGPFGWAPGLHWMLGKTLFLFFVIFWARWSLVRFRADQLMRLCWLWLVPLSLLAVCGAALWVAFSGGAA